jgi:surface antigen
MARTVDAAGEQKPVAVTMSGGGEIGLHSMDATDKQKMSRALDAATGKSTSWVNGRSGIKYTITPIKKVIIQNNPFCRQYQADAEKGDSKKAMNGTACVMTDGSWHTI